MSRLGDKPTLKELDCFTYISSSGTEHKIYIINAVATRWRSLGLALGFEGYELEIIKINHPDQVEMRSHEVFAQWLSQKCSKTATWETLLQAMKKARCGTVAEQVRKALIGCVEVPPLTNTCMSSIFPACLMDSCTWKSIILSAILTLVIAAALILHCYALISSLVSYHTPQPAINHSSSLPESLVHYQVYLRDVYHKHNYSRHSKPSEFLSANRPEQPINLVLVHKEDSFDTSHNEQVKFAFYGKVDEIQKRKTPIDIEKIGSMLKMNAVAHFVLIEGAPGIGKSTLCWQLCRLWSEGKMQQMWDLVVLVELRDETTRKATIVYDLFYHPDDKIRESIAQEMQKREGEGLLIIFDGYDELSDNQRSEFSVVQQILSNKILNKATIVVTSRPIATKGLPAQFKQTLDQHIEIAGFNKTDIQTYITLACKDNIEMLKALQSYVSSRPFIFSIMYNPLHCTIVTELYIQNWLDGRKGFAPNTLTELYSALVLLLLRRSLPLNQSSEIEGLTDLPTHVYNNLMLLAELAATGLERKQYIYNSIPCDTCTHGLMVSVKQLHDIRPKQSAYMFLHLTLQEYLSALYWNHQPQQKQTDFLHELKISYKKELHWLQHNEELNLLSYVHFPHLLFLAGLTKLDSLPLEVIIPSQTIGPICQLLFETQSPQKVSNFFSNKRHMVTFYDPFECFAIGYCIANSDNTSSWDILNLESLQHLQLLSDGLHYFKNTMDMSSSEVTIKMSIWNSANEHFKIFPRLYPFTKAITHILLNDTDSSYPDNTSFSVLQNLSHYCPNLKSLYIICGSFVLTKPPSIPEETIVTIKLELPHDSVEFDSLHKFRALSKIQLHSDRQTDVCLSMKKNFPKFTSNLTSIQLFNVSIDKSCVDGLVHLLKSSLIQLKINRCIFSYNEFYELITAIATSKLKQLEFTGSFEIDVKMGKSLARLLTQSKTLEEITLPPMDCTVARLLDEARTHSNVKKLSPSSNKCREVDISMIEETE